MYSEEKNWDWYDIAGYTDFIRHIHSNAVKMQKFPLCIKESGGMFERGKDKAKFLEELSHISGEDVLELAFYISDLVGASIFLKLLIACSTSLLNFNVAATSSPEM
jgi:hypothetical protein